MKINLNFLHYINVLTEKLLRWIHYAVFLFLKKTFYLLSYNTAGNRFVCK